MRAMVVFAVLLVGLFALAGYADAGIVTQTVP
jgi:hypothetical protein